MKFISKVVGDKDDLVSTAGFAFIEGAVLYSSFAFLKHFQSQECGKDLAKNICRGINLSVADENTHAVGSALLHNTIYKESNLSVERQEELARITMQLAEEVYEHEEEVINRIFSKGEISGITKENMQDFVKHRINLILNSLGYNSMFEDEEMDGYIASWFYTNINSIQFSDFFTGSGSEYHIDWKEERFGSVW